MSDQRLTWRKHLPRLAVFCGPSLPEADRIEAPGVNYLPPAARGDVERAARDHDAVLLIDGVFHHDLAPSPKECYVATRHARLWGASSMGALRAAECWPCGFTPLGVIARWYVSERIDGDDEVAVLTHPQTHAAITVPLVNARYVAWLAVRRRIFSQQEADTYIRRVRDIFYMDRSLADLIESAPVHCRERIGKIVELESDLKRWDARFALRSVLRACERGLVEKSPQRTAPTITAREHLLFSHSSPITLPPSVPKITGTYDRAVSFSTTSNLVPLLRERYGVTRVGDTTWLDRTGIPTFCAMVPHSPDLLGVYNGKGLTREAAMVSAVMEAAERQIGSDIRLPVFSERIPIITERLDLDACGIRDSARNLTVECVLGTDLLTGDAIPVPLALVQCPWYGDVLFDVTSTNGLASGNNLTEAIYHALCELVERHAWAMYHVRCSLAPRLFGGPTAKEICVAPEIQLPTGDPVVDGLVEKMRASGLTVRVLLLDESPLPYTFLAAVTEPGLDPPMAHMGMGCALSPAHAITRALTEAVQSRVVDIQAAREDILRPGEDAGVLGDHGRRLKSLPTGRWYYDIPGPIAKLSDIPDRTTSDLATDVQQVLAALREEQISTVAIVDISPKEAPISVVRAIVPGLETLMLHGRLGSRAKALLNPFSGLVSPVNP